MEYHKPSYELKWNSNFSPYYGDTIYLPEGLILWRAYEPTTEPILSRPSHYSSKATTSLPNRSQSAFFTTCHLSLFDIRFLTSILQRFFQNRIGISYNPSEVMCIRAATMSLGLCSATHQLKLLKQQYSNDPENLKKTNQMEHEIKKSSFIEEPGVRIKEPLLEGITMSFLKNLFEGSYDGIISPPTSDEHSSIEIILFDPKRAGIQAVKDFPTNVSMRDMFDFTSGYRQRTTCNYPYTISKIFTTNYPAIEEFNSLLEKNEDTAVELANLAEKVGQKWNSRRNSNWKECIHTLIPPSPSVPLSIFTSNSLELNTGRLELN
jgi:hypothetical protein